MEFENVKSDHLDLQDESGKISYIKHKIDLFNRNIWRLEEVKEFFKFDPMDIKFKEKYESWYKVKYSEKLDINNINIWRLEEYLKWQGIIQIDDAAAKLGMEVNSFKTVLNKYIQKLMAKTFFTDELVYKDVVQDITKYLFININIFKNHTEYCKIVHEKLKGNGLEVTPLYCETSIILQESEPLFSFNIDDFTGEPVSEKYSLWLDFKKPITLKPYTCSLKTYALYRSILKDYLMGDEPEEELLEKIKGSYNEKL
jgi:hypothetical protein